jgi:hypothetical protein
MNQPSMIDAFFERDLSEAEDQQLAQEIDASIGSSQRFASRMAEAWQQAGLAEPRPPRRLAKAWLWGGGAALLLGLGLWTASSHQAGEEPLALVTQAGAGYRYEAPQAGLAPGQRLPAQPALRGLASLLQVHAEPGKGFTIQVELAKPGLAQLSVVDSQGRVLSWLNQASLASGSHSFAWPDPGKAGRYCIVLKTSQGSSQRWVRVGGLP